MTTRFRGAWLLPAWLIAMPLGGAEQDEVRAAIARGDWSVAVAAAERWRDHATPGTEEHALASLHLAQAALGDDAATRDHHATAIAIAALETVVASGRWPAEQTRAWRYGLVQLCVSLDRLDAAERHFETWLAAGATPTHDAWILSAHILLRQAAEADESGARELTQRALARIEAGLRLTVAPDVNALRLKVHCLQTLERWDDAAEWLELALHHQPQQATRWRELCSLYLAAGNPLRTVVTIERARDRGELASADMDLMLGQLCYNLGQPVLALEHLESGLRRGGSDSSATWLLAAWLAYSAHDDERAIRLLTAGEQWFADERSQRDRAELRRAIDARQR